MLLRTLLRPGDGGTLRAGEQGVLAARREAAGCGKGHPPGPTVSCESRHGTIPTYTNPNFNSKLVKFLRTDGGQSRYACVRAPDNECKLGVAFSNVVRHLSSRH